LQRFPTCEPGQRVQIDDPRNLIETVRNLQQLWWSLY